MIDVFDFQIQISPDSKTFELKFPVQAVMYQFWWQYMLSITDESKPSLTPGVQ